MRPEAAQAAPVLSRALTRVLNATESKENEAEEERSDQDVGESPEDAGQSGKTRMRLSSYGCMKGQECKI